MPSPDGTRVAVAVPLGAPPLSYAEELDVIALADGSRREIFQSDNGLVSLAWSPDSRQVAFLWNNDVAPSLLAQNADGSSTGLFGSQHGALPTEVGMAGPIYWQKRGIVGFTRGADASGFIGFYDVVTGKDIYDAARPNRWRTSARTVRPHISTGTGSVSRPGAASGIAHSSRAAGPPARTASSPARPERRSSPAQATTSLTHATTGWIRSTADPAETSSTRTGVTSFAAANA